MTTYDHPHSYFMNVALRHAARGLGQTAPNPAVGCVIVADHQIVATGYTGKGGRPHAETVALEKAGEQAKGATAYVTLEPCCHHGQTPPCTDALIAAGIAKVVIATTDPHPQVAGKGIEALQTAGIEVITGICEEEARWLNAGFFSVVEKGRPFVTVKLATSADGMIAHHDGSSKWITGELARSYGHLLRAEHDAIMVGTGTVLADNPSLTCRLPGLEDRSPTRIILDTSGKIAADKNVIDTACDVPTWIFTASDNHPLQTSEGVRIFKIDQHDNVLDMKQALAILAEQGITRLMVEGGSQLVASLLQADLVDQLVWMQAPKTIGKDGIPAIADRNIAALDGFENTVEKLLGDDRLMVSVSSS